MKKEILKKLSVILISIIVFGCQTSNNEDLSSLNDPVVINIDTCFDNADKEMRVCLESVTDDSRCPTGVVCVWEGDAVANLTIKTKNEINSFQLHTNNRFQNETVLQGYRIKLLSVSPYPSANSQIDQKDYSTEISVVKD